MDISFHSDKILSKDVHFSWGDIFTYAISFAVSCYVLHIFLLIDTCDITRVQNIIYVLKHLFIDYLSITE